VLPMCSFAALSQHFFRVVALLVEQFTELIIGHLSSVLLLDGILGGTVLTWLESKHGLSIDEFMVVTK